MTEKNRSTSVAEQADEHWVAHLRDLSAAVAPPTAADPQAMSRTAVRRTRTRRAVLATGGGAMTVAVVAATAFALGGPTTPEVLLPGAPASATESGVTAGAPDGWTEHEVAGLHYALPPGLVTSGPVHDEPGVTSDMWHSGADPDSPPFVRVASVTPDYEFYDATAGGLTQIPGPGATEFDLPGAAVATVESGDSKDLRESAGVPSGGPNEPIRVIVHRADGPDRYLITMNVPKNSDDLVDGFLSSLALD